MYLFLKRSWRYEEELGLDVCPLEHDSINKMLTVCTKSKTISEKHQAMACMSTAIREYFWYGREVFEKKRILFLQIIEECDLEFYLDDSILPTWETLIYEFKDKSKHYKASWKPQPQVKKHFKIPFF